MPLKDILDVTEKLKALEGVEGELLRRRRRSAIGLGVATVGAVYQFSASFLSKDGLLKSLGQFVAGQWGDLDRHELIGGLVLVVGAATWIVCRYTSLLLREVEEPFRYTFWIEAFKQVAETPGTRFTLGAADRFKLLHHDLRERLDRRIGRFSLLKDTKEDEHDQDNIVADERLGSHIHVSGDYAFREDRKGSWVVHVMPRIRIGGKDSPATLAPSVKYPLEGRLALQGAAPPGAGKAVEWVLDADQYNRIVERVYSRLATEIYKQIERDVTKKIRLFPTGYLRAVATFHEAEDFARSNTIDAYDRALELYQRSLRYFEVALFRRAFVGLTVLPLLWRWQGRFQLMEARVRTGHARCVVFRRYASALTGRSSLTLFGVRRSLEEVDVSLRKLQARMTRRPVMGRLATLLSWLTFPGDSPRQRILLAPTEAAFARLRQVRCETLTVLALVLEGLGATERADERLADARAIDPPWCDQRALHIFARGQIERRLDQKILLFQRATEAVSDFQIAHYQLAYTLDMRFRSQDGLDRAKARHVLEEYERVLMINPGNIAALAGQGYILWLIGRPNKARKRLEEGLEIKAVVAETYVGELTYGLARIAAEKGSLNRSHRLYKQAISADPGIAAYTVTVGQARTSWYDYVVPAMVARYRAFCRAARKQCRRARGAGTVSANVLDAVESFVLNDFGNACINNYIRHGGERWRRVAGIAYRLAVQRNRRNAVAQFNRYEAWLRDDRRQGGGGGRGRAVAFAEGETPAEELKRASEAIPTWLAPLLARAESITDIGRWIEEEETRKKEQTDDLTELQKEEADVRETLDRLDRLTQVTGEAGAESRQATVPSEYPPGVEVEVSEELQDAVRQRRPVSSAAAPDIRRPAAVKADGTDKQRWELPADMERREQSARHDRVRGLIQELEAEIASGAARTKDFEGERTQILKDLKSGIFDTTRIAQLFESLRTRRMGWLLTDPFAAPQSISATAGSSGVSRGDAGAARGDATNGAAEAPAFRPSRLSWRCWSWRGAPSTRSRIQWKLLNEEDVQALRTWARILPSLGDEHGNEVQRLDDARTLLRHILEEFYPDDFDSLFYLRGVLERVLKSRPGLARDEETRASLQKELADCTTSLKTIMNGWLLADPTHFNALLWHQNQDFFELKELRDAIGRAWREKANDSASLAPLIKCYTDVVRPLADKGRFDEAIEAFEKFKEVDPEASRGELARLHAARGQKHAARGEYTAAVEEHGLAKDLQSGVAAYADRLATALEQVTEPDKVLAHLERARDARREALRLDPRNAAFRNRLAELEARHAMVAACGEKVPTLLPLVTPIAIEVGKDIVPLVEDQATGNLNKTLQDRIGRRRERLRQEFGVQFPGLRFRGNEGDLPGSTYIIMLEEVPLVVGTLPADSLLVHRSPSALPAGVPTTPVPDPVTQQDCAWILRADRDRAGLPDEDIDEPLDYMLRHVESVLRRNLATFIGHQEVLDLIRSSAGEASRGFEARLLAAPATLDSLVTALRGLLLEEVPIRRLTELLASVEDTIWTGKSTVAVLIERMRLAVRDDLPGNSERFSFHELGPQTEAALLADLDRSGPQPVLAMEPEACRELLASIRNAIGDQRTVALVTRPELRVHVRALTQIGWPAVPVLSRAEWFRDLRIRRRSIIEREAAP